MTARRKPAVSTEVFRRMALELPDAEESAHMGHPDFRVGGKIFATLQPTEGWGMVKLTPEQQEAVVASAPKAFAPVKGGWGRGGATTVHLDVVSVKALGLALSLARDNVARPKPRKKK